MTIYGRSNCISDAHCHQRKTVPPDVIQYLAQKKFISLNSSWCLRRQRRSKLHIYKQERESVCVSRSKFGDGGGDVLQGGSSLGGGESLDGLQSLVAMVTA